MTRRSTARTGLLAAAILMLALCCPGVGHALIWPVGSGTVTSAPGWRVDPLERHGTTLHHGWDIAVPTGTKVHATGSGVVVYAATWKGYGQLVAIRHARGWFSLYGHNAKLLVRQGQRVREGAVVALSGDTGRSTGPHVHYEVRRAAER